MPGKENYKRVITQALQDMELAHAWKEEADQDEFFMDRLASLETSEARVDELEDYTKRLLCQIEHLQRQLWELKNPGMQNPMDE